MPASTMFIKNYIFVYNTNDPEEKIFMINKNEFDENIHRISKNHFQKGKVLVKDCTGNRFFVNVDDERYISGELQANYTGYKFTDEQKLKLKQKFKAINHQKGEKNSQFGTKWITKDGITIKVKKEVLNDYLDNGWKLGMK